jgi:hypothetical protein
MPGAGHILAQRIRRVDGLNALRSAILLPRRHILHSSARRDTRDTGFDAVGNAVPEGVGGPWKARGVVVGRYHARGWWLS